MSERLEQAYGGEDRISALPDELLQRALSFLPSRDAVRTCVLARRWRHQWKSVPALRIADIHKYRSPQHWNDFVNNLVLRRSWSPLDLCKIYICLLEDVDEQAFQYIGWWIQYALLCQVRVLHVDIAGIQLPNVPLVSRHLERLELSGVMFGGSDLDFSNCVVLAVLKMESCIITAKRILSNSLRCLSITECDFTRNRTRISCPGLISLKLADFFLRTPSFASMPSLVSAFVRLGEHCDDYCFDEYYGECGNCTPMRQASKVDGEGSVLLNGLSDAVHLELIADAERFIFRKDFKCCPTFNKLKTLLLNEWCSVADFAALVYFLEHSPILEKLTLHLWGKPATMLHAGGKYNPHEVLLASKHLKVVEVKYLEDEMLLKCVQILSICGIPSEKISIQRMSLWSSEGFSFEQRTESSSATDGPTVS